MSEEGFNSLIEELAKNLHDTEAFAKLRQAMKNLKKTKARREFLGPKLTRDPISFDSVKKRWQEDKQEANRFHFLQGDIVSCLSVLEPGKARSSTSQSLWMVKSADCDIARKEPYAEVTPIFRVHGKKNTPDILKAQANVAWQLASDRLFPLPHLQQDDQANGVTSYVANLSIPGFIRRSDFPLATQVTSLAPTGWILFKNLLHRRYTRAVNLDEALAIHMATPEGLGEK